MNSSLKRQLLKSFVQMISDLKSVDEIELFLKDFLSDLELETYVKRMSIVYWLKKKRDEENIKRNLIATKKEIDYAKKIITRNGVKLALKKMEAEEWANIWNEKIKKIGNKVTKQ